VLDYSRTISSSGILCTTLRAEIFLPEAPHLLGRLARAFSDIVESLLAAKQVPTTAHVRINGLSNPSKFGTNLSTEEERRGTSQLCRFNQRLFENIPPTIRALRGLFQNVIRHTRIGTGDPVENVIEWNLSAFLIAVLARLNEPLRLAESCGLDKHDNLLFWWVKHSGYFRYAFAAIF
jgi:hypothetical protein